MLLLFNKGLYRQSSKITKREKRFVMSDANKRLLTRTGFGKLPVKGPNSENLSQLSRTDDL